MATRQLRVLLAENRLSEAGIILRSLCAEAGWSLELIFVGARASLAHALTTHCPEVALVDFSMLQPDAPALLRVLHRTCPSIPLILFADPADKAFVVNCLSMGAVDFLLKGFMDERTMSRVLRAAVAREPDRVPRHSLPSEVSTFSARCLSPLATPPGPQSSVTSGDDCVLTVSVENFEHVRFWMGTLAVDRMLGEIAQVLKKCVRDSDEVVLLSYGQLGITFHHVGESSSRVILQRIRAKVKSHLVNFRLNPSPVFSIHEANVPLFPRHSCRRRSRPRRALRIRLPCSRRPTEEIMMEAVHVELPVITATEGPLRLLLLEKSLADCQDILEELRAAGISIEPTVVATREEFLDAISSQDFSMILSEFDLPRWNGVDALHELRKSGRPTPFILVTGILGKDAAAECLRLGASDYILKDHLVRLPMALKRMLEEKRLRDANEAAQQALQENETRNRELIENSVYGVFRASLDGSFLFANPALLQILACSSLSVLQSLSLATDVFRFPEQYVKLLASCRAGGFVPSTEAEWRRKDGGLVAVKLHLRYLSYPGAPDHIEGIVEDITEIRALEHQLLQVQKFETIGQLAGGIAHDFNNVVGAILGWAELGYEESQAFPSIAERFARIRSQADRAAALTRELLSYAHCQELRPRPVDLNSVIQGLSTFLDKVLGSDIEMKLTLGELQPVHADPIQISQVLMNLCLNARDAMPNGGRLLIETEMIHLDDCFCRFYPHLTPGRHAVFSVSDTGTGMTQEIRERIFEPLFTTKERGTASGMGLASAYGIVKQHGGFIHVYSEAGQGSLFRVYLPAMQEAPPATSLKPEANGFSQTTSLAGTETILLAEDHDSIREMARQWLANLGYHVLSAADGEEALLLCDQRTPAVAVLDLVMPRLGGAATAIQLRTRFPKLPILFTSGYSESSGTTVSQLPNSSYLQKPYSPTSLGRELRKILDPVSSRQT